MADSIDGKISSPFSSTSSRLPSRIGGPSSTPIAPGELGIAGVVQASERVLDLFFARLQVESNEPRGDRQTDRSCCDIVRAGSSYDLHCKARAAMVSRTEATVCSSSHRRGCEIVMRTIARRPRLRISGTDGQGSAD